MQLSVEITNSACVRRIRECLNFESEVTIDESAGAGSIGNHTVNSKDLGACRVREERARHVDISGEEEVRARWGGERKGRWEVEIEPRCGGYFRSEPEYEVVRGLFRDNWIFRPDVEGFERSSSDVVENLVEGEGVASI